MLPLFRLTFQTPQNRCKIQGPFASLLFRNLHNLYCLYMNLHLPGNAVLIFLNYPGQQKKYRTRVPCIYVDPTQKRKYLRLVVQCSLNVVNFDSHPFPCLSGLLSPGLPSPFMHSDQLVINLVFLPLLQTLSIPACHPTLQASFLLLFPPPPLPPLPCQGVAVTLQKQRNKYRQLSNYKLQGESDDFCFVLINNDMVNVKEFYFFSNFCQIESNMSDKQMQRLYTAATTEN